MVPTDSDCVANIAEVVRTGSLLCVCINPTIYHLEANVGAIHELIDDGFTAFKAPIIRGELDYRSYADGVGLPVEIAEDFSLALPNSAMLEWRAVVPGADGIIGRQWEHPTG